MTDMAWITAGGFLTLIVTQFTNLFVQRRNRKWDLEDRGLVAAAAKTVATAAKDVGETAAIRVAEVAATLKEGTESNAKKLNELGVVIGATHTLVNNAMAVQLGLNAAMATRLADLTHDPIDMAAAEQATKLYAEHQKKQAIVDKQDQELKEKEKGL